jgi:hypothetical protein
MAKTLEQRFEEAVEEYNDIEGKLQQVEQAKEELVTAREQKRGTVITLSELLEEAAEEEEAPKPPTRKRRTPKEE